jgi:hypothetical protein
VSIISGLSGKRGGLINDCVFLAMLCLKRYGERDMGTLTIIPLPGREREGRECKKY